MAGQGGIQNCGDTGVTRAFCCDRVDAIVEQNQAVELAGGPGFEPRLTESESAVLPLNYPPVSH